MKKETPQERLQALTAIVGQLSTRMTLAYKLGKQYGTDRDVYEALGYPTDLSYADFAARYERQDIAKAIIDRPVNMTWKGPLVLVESDDDEETPFEKEWIVMEQTLKLKNRFARLDKLACIGNYALLLMGWDDVRSSTDFLKPVTGRCRLLYAKPVSEGSAVVNEWVNDAKDERYGLPKTYKIQMVAPGGGDTTVISVHYSRVIHVAYNLLDDEVEGESMLKGVYNRLMDLEKLVGGSAEMFWRGARPGYQGVIDPDYTMTSEAEDELQDQIDEFEHKLRRILINQGIELKALAPQVSDPKSHVEIQIQMISAITGIPKRILTGSERGELASSQDETSWLSLIQTRREEYAETLIIRPFVEQCMRYGALPDSEGYSVGWEDLFAVSEKDKVEVGKVRATALKEYVQNPMAESIVPPSAFFEFFLGLTQDQIELINEMMEAQIKEDDALRKQMEEEGQTEETEETIPTEEENE